MTSSGKLAHYGPGLVGRPIRFGSLADCLRAAETGRAPDRLPAWLN
jgi:predicted aconitase